MAKRRSTPRQIAASRRNLAIARSKRRRRIVTGIAAGTAITAGIAGGLVVHRYTSSLKGGPKRPNMPGKQLDVLRVQPTGKNWHIVGKPIQRTNLDGVKRKRKRLNYVQHEQKRVRRQIAAQNKNYKARRKYWQSKPVAKTQYVVRRKRG